MSNPLFGRKWALQVTDADGNVLLSLASEPFGGDESLRITFEVCKQAYSVYWFGDIAIYNLNRQTEQKVLTQGMMVTLSAGYADGNYGQIFKGPVFQPFWEKEDEVTYKITLHCIVPLVDLVNNFAYFSRARGATQVDLINQMAEQARTPLTITNLSPNISKTTHPRGIVVFGSPDDTLDDISADNNMQWWIDEVGINMGNPNDVSPPPAIVYCPAGVGPIPVPAGAFPAIIGTPQQTQQGVVFRVLLDPRLLVQYPAQQVKIDNSQIRQQLKRINQFSTILDQDGVYKVGSVTHRGDSRGDTWETEVLGLTGAGGQLAMLSETNQQDMSGGTE